MLRFLIPGVFALTVGLALPVAGKEKTVPWSTSIEPVAASDETWHELIRDLMDHKMYFTALSASQQVLALFSDQATKTLVAQTVVTLTDMGYPFPIRNLLSTVDIEPETPGPFTDSFFLYKGISNFEKGMPRWSMAYWERLDQARDTKYHLFSAIQKYSKNDLEGAETFLKNILTQTTVDTSPAFTSKVARTLARIYFEKKEHAKALEIYGSYLLKLEYVLPTDWLEAAWNLYYLKKYKETLGYLYNLEPLATTESYPEKYMLRALVYRDLCASGALQQLQNSFEGEYGSALKSIRSGEPLSAIPALRTLPLEENMAYVESSVRKRKLAGEASRISSLSSKLRPLAEHLFTTENRLLDGKLQALEENALKESAAFLINLDETLKYLQFEVTREAFSPERVFASQQPSPESTTSPVAEGEIRWPQTGMLWRDERLSYQASIQNECQTK